MESILLSVIEKYYSDKVKMFGSTPLGVDWNGKESQFLRFEILSEIIEEKNGTILDYGCGYGAFYDFLKEKKIIASFTGYDISSEMIREAKKKHDDGEWITELEPNKKYDYIFASGIFNIVLNNDKKEWEKYVFDTIRRFDQMSNKGFAFNMLTTYSDKEKSKEHLFYAEPENIFQFCKQNISNRIILDHGYPLYEFTIKVKK